MAGRVTRSTGEVLAWPLGQYFICRVIDSGKFGTVYHARHEASGRDVALKLIPLEGVDSDEKVAAERHGALLQQRFGQTHKRLVPEVYEHQPLAAFYAIAMELVHGQPLTELIEAGPLPPERAAAIALAICRFLESAHQFATDIEGVHYELIVHADLKPDHVLLLDEGEIRVLDFGIAKALATRTLVTTNKWGSMQYASPERLQSDGHVNEQADFWSLGVILFEMVAGFRPYRQYEHTPSRLDAAIRRQETPETLPPGSNQVLSAIIHKLLAPQAERRYASASAIAGDLAAFLHGGPVLAATERAHAGQDTVRILPRAPSAPPSVLTEAAPAAPPRQDPVPTERLPMAALRPGSAGAPGAPGVLAGSGGPSLQQPVVASSQPSAGAVPARPARASRIVRLGRGLAVGALVALVASEGSGFVRAERIREQISSVEIAHLAAVRDEYREMGAWAPLGLGRALRLDDVLTDRMVELAGRTILEYRRETPTVSQVQWEQARECLDLALEISPDDRRIASRRSYVEGQLSRIAGRDINDALGHFREAARLDPESPDPYLGLARVFAYSTIDIPALTQAIVDAEDRGYSSGRRERAQLGDAYRVRAERARVAASRLTGDERTTRLQEAADDYAQCVSRFEGLFFFDSERNLRACRRRLESITHEIQRATPAPSEIDDPSPSDHAYRQD